MRDVYRETSSPTGEAPFFLRLLGLVIFAGGFPLIWWGETRPRAADEAAAAAVADPAAPNASLDGRLVSVTGPLEAKDAVGDPEGLKPGPYVRLQRRVDVYAWVEKRTTAKREGPDGKEVSETTYTYETEWTDDPPNSGIFRHSLGHENRPAKIRAEAWTAPEARVGAYAFRPADAELPSPEPLSLTEDLLVAATGGFARPTLDGDRIHIGTGTPYHPAVGDARISYAAVRSGTPVTLFGRQEGGRIVPHALASGGALLRAVRGAREEAVKSLAAEEKLLTWVVRAIGFVLMGGGLVAFPLHLMLGGLVLPGLRTAGKALTAVSAFALAAALAAATIAAAGWGR